MTFLQVLKQWTNKLSRDEWLMFGTILAVSLASALIILIW